MHLVFFVAAQVPSWSVLAMMASLSIGGLKSEEHVVKTLCHSKPSIAADACTSVLQ